jgi:hypothetical protein
VIVIQHTFGGLLNHNPHLHIMVSAGGMNPAEARCVGSLKFNREEIMFLWRYAVTSYLRNAYQRGFLLESFLPLQFEDLITR